LPYDGVVDPETQNWMRERLTPRPVRCFEQPPTLTDPDALQSIPQPHISTTTIMSLRKSSAFARRPTAGYGISTPATT
jgi:hypothetical protein